MLLLAAMLLAPTITGCGNPNSFQPPPTPEVLVTLPTFQNVTRYIEQTGTAQASELVEVRSRVSGYIKEIKFNDGDLVEEQQLLFVIDEEPFIVKLQYAQAKKSEAEAKLQRAKQSKAREISRANLDLATAEHELAQSSYKRISALLDRKATPQADFDQAEATLQKAGAQVLAARAELDQAETSFASDILSAEAALALADSEVRSAKIDLDYCRIKAPFSGLIDRRAVDVGNYIAMDASTVLSRIVRVDPIYAYAAINQADLIRLKNRNSEADPEGAIPVTVGVDESQAAPLDGVVNYIAPSVHQGTGTVQIRGVFKNAGVITPGMFVRLRIPAEVVENAILVPERSLGYDQAGTYVYVVNSEQKIERRSVTAGDAVDEKRVIRGSIDAEDQIVADGLLKVRPEMKVTIKWLETRQEEKRAAAQSQPPSEHAKHASAAGSDF
jgi:RND family efflux transporter MFP subunit